MKKEMFEIKITGAGSREDIVSALRLIADSVLKSPVEEIDGANWEDCTLLTEISILGENPVLF